jgi:hypothetical protein
MVAWEPVSKTVVKNVSFQAYATSDTAFTTPLTITDTFGSAIPGNILNSGTLGVFQQFKHATEATVVIADATRTYAWTVIAIQPPTQDTVVASFVSTAGSATQTALNATFIGLIQAAKNPDLLVAGAIVRDGSDQITSAAVLWPDGSPGTLTITSRDSTGAILAYNITYGSPVTKTFTQPTITRNANGAATNVPQIVVS